jgi:hypothetical protein
MQYFASAVLAPAARSGEALRAVKKPQTSSPIDLRLRVVALALEPGLTLARLSGLSLDDLQALVATGYFRQFRARGLSLRGTARAMDKSVRTVATLSQKAGADGTLSPLGARIAWRRKLLARVAEAGAIERKKLVATVRGEPRAEVDAEIQQLLDEGVLAASQGSIAVAVKYLRMIDQDVDARLDSLRHFLDAVTQTIHQRFFGDDALALARVLTFRADIARLTALRDETYAKLRDGVIAADNEAGAEARGATVAFCISESPTPLTGWR